MQETSGVTLDIPQAKIRPKNILLDQIFQPLLAAQV